jgi:drug/metabolite transporter superfamily protein YnfA
LLQTPVAIRSQSDAAHREISCPSQLPRWPPPSTGVVNLVFAAIAVAGALMYMRSIRPATRPRMDWPGAILACAGLFLIVFGFSHAETAG